MIKVLWCCSDAVLALNYYSDSDIIALSKADRSKIRCDAGEGS